jgi:hypothetical protein
MSAHTRFGRKTAHLHGVGFCWGCGQRARVATAFTPKGHIGVFCAKCRRKDDSK